MAHRPWTNIIKQWHAALEIINSNNPQLQDPFARDVVADRSARFTLNNHHDNTFKRFKILFNLQ